MGRIFHGWQIQANAESVEATIENTLSLLLGEPTDIVGAGRTDAGVHASFMTAHFDHSTDLNLEDLTHRLNGFLPKSIAIQKIVQVVENAHARFDATARTYLYKITQQKNPFLEGWAYEYKHPLDIRFNESGSTIIAMSSKF